MWLEEPRAWLWCHCHSLWVGKAWDLNLEGHSGPCLTHGYDSTLSIKSFLGDFIVLSDTRESASKSSSLSVIQPFIT